MLKREELSNVNKYEIEIQYIEEEYRKSPNSTILNKIVKAKYELKIIFSQKAEYSLYRLKQKWYESGNKAGKLLASQLKAKHTA